MGRFSVWLLGTLAGAVASAQVGMVDETFYPGTGANLEDTSFRRFFCVEQSDGKLLIAGNFLSVDGVPRVRVARLEKDGRLDQTFDVGTGPRLIGRPCVQALALQPDGKVLVGGHFTDFNGLYRNRIVRLHSDGSVDTSFNCIPGPDVSVSETIVCPDGRILIGGAFTKLNGVPRRFVARLNSNGSADFSFDSSANKVGVLALALQPDGKVIVAGYGYYIDSDTRIVRLNPDGSRDFTFRANAEYNIYAVALEPNGKVMIAGDFDNVNGGNPRVNIARLNSDGSTDWSFNANIAPSWDNPITCLARTADGKWLAGGHFTIDGGYPANNLLRLNPDGSFDPTFGCTTGPDEWVSSIVLRKDGRAVIGGHFSFVNGVPRNRIARLYGDPRLDARSVPTGVETSWPSVYTNFVLQTASTLSPTNWITVSNTPAVVSNICVVTNTITTSGHQFFRLATP